MSYRKPNTISSTALPGAEQNYFRHLSEDEDKASPLYILLGWLGGCLFNTLGWVILIGLAYVIFKTFIAPRLGWYVP